MLKITTDMNNINTEIKGELSTIVAELSLSITGVLKTLAKGNDELYRQILQFLLNDLFEDTAQLEDMDNSIPN